MRVLGLVFAISVAFYLVAGGRADAQDKESIAIISLEISGDAPPELRQQVQAHIAEGLAATFTVVGLDETRDKLRASPELIGCFSSDCLLRIGDTLSVELFVRAVLVANGAHYDLSLELLRTGQDPMLQNSVTASCSICTIEDLNERSVDAARRLLIVDAKKRMRVTVASIPGGAIISVDGLEAGTSPIEIELEPGSHDVSAVLPGYATSVKSIEVRSGTDKDQRFELPLVQPVTAASHTPRAPRFRRLKWGTAAASGALLILGTTLIVIDNNPTCDDSSQQCKYVRDTMLSGVLSLSGAVLSGAAAGWMFWSDAGTTRLERPIVQITRHGASAGVAFDF